MFKTFKYRLYPTIDQAKKIDLSIGVCRFVYNLALEVKIWAYQGGINLTSVDLCYQLVELRQAFDWVKEVDSQALQASVKKVDVAFENFFNGKGYPKFKRKRNGGSFRCPNNTRRIDWQKGTLTIPKIRDIPIVLSRKFEGRIKTVTIRKTSTGKYFAAILVDTGQGIAKPGSVVHAKGIDLGLIDFAVLSDGEKIQNPKFLACKLDRMKVLQRRASRKIKGSQNRKKAFQKVGLLHEKIFNERSDFLHKLSTRIVSDSQTDTICVESLNVRNLLKNHCLAGAISDASWSRFVKMLSYKAKWRGKNFIHIDQWFPSSKTCSECGHILNQIELSVRKWQCPECEAWNDRDINAAINIHNKGIETGVGSPEAPVESWRKRRTKKQENMQL